MLCHSTGLKWIPPFSQLVLMGTHQGAVSHEHLDYYLDEFTFRFNRRNSRHRGKLFYRLLQQAVSVEPMTYGRLVKHNQRPKSEMHNI